MTRARMLVDWSHQVCEAFDQILATRDRKHYLVTYSDGDTWMHSQDLMPQSISLV